MILSDRDLQTRLFRGDLVIEPLDEPEVQIQPASIDLRLGRTFLVPGESVAPIDSHDGRGGDYRERVLSGHEPLVLYPGDFVLGSTMERVRVPPDLVGRVEGRSSLGRLAIVVHATAGFVDPGFEGQITLELSNLGRAPVALHPGMRICQFVLHVLSSAAERPYGSERGSKYQGQIGPTPSRIQRGR